MADQISTSIVRICAFGNPLETLWRTGADLVRLVTGSSAGDTLVKSSELSLPAPGPVRARLPVTAELERESALDGTG